MECDNAGMDDAQRACLARLQEMDAALARMERELPDDVQGFGREARRKVAAWRERLERDNPEPSQLSEGLREISRMMDALSARLLLVPWDGPPRTGSKS